MWVFDAKFRLQAGAGQGESDPWARSDDIHKMHAYRDALPDCRGAYVVYPGDGNRMLPNPGVAESNGLNGVDCNTSLCRLTRLSLKQVDIMPSLRGCTRVHNYRPGAVRARKPYMQGTNGHN